MPWLLPSIRPHMHLALLPSLQGKNEVPSIRVKSVGACLLVLSPGSFSSAYKDFHISLLKKNSSFCPIMPLVSATSCTSFQPCLEAYPAIRSLSLWGPSELAPRFCFLETTQSEVRQVSHVAANGKFSSYFSTPFLDSTVNQTVPFSLHPLMSRSD